MSVALVNELKEIESELNRMKKTRFSLIERKEQIEGELLAFLQEKGLPGMKSKDVKVTIENTNRSQRKKKNDKLSSAKEVLENHGIDDPDSVLEELLESMKGEKESVTKLKLSALEGTKRGRKKKTES